MISHELVSSVYYWRLADVIYPDAGRIANQEASYWAPDPG